ncbi:MAG: phage shock protein operon transcriptional activator [Rhodospirillaceae bacterium]|jgi:psp operon transcriptional activator|nr:phage shock protein operon transcriptional activator [Rhodospirillaceae bacterium]MBT5566224.1 phage shock protein operon transcriptional activator [Rhodospirillaceae bacterium]MBT6088942.1 phage shock protein operon transcriptional activator [Rhodospirillaceae bacterium]MBT6962432.1 phage shock protein operon transcriptional activator [Rhodospirillaceae bacterium]
MTDRPAPLGQSPAFLTHMDDLSRVAPIDRPVLIIGERGTGKELSASRVHYLSTRWGAPFVAINCAALPESLLEAELFGVEPGAFTGAAQRREGRFERADGGTLFLDEIGNAPLAVQEKILRVIEYGEFERLGGSETLTVSVRIVAATNADLPAMAKEGTFRDDLLDRLAFDVLTLPPLRARTGDISLLAGIFGRGMANELDRPSFPGFSKAALKVLEGYAWPGNVRELRNVAERAVASTTPSDAPVDIDAIVLDPFASPYRLSAPASSSDKITEVPQTSSAFTAGRMPCDFKTETAAFEINILENALDACRHNQKAAAAYLGLSYHQLRNSLRKHGLLPSQEDAS